jgi:acyl-coenzyme A thioesterase PaaI-like protein
VTIINGGATVSLLAFVGGLAAQGKVQFGQLASLPIA